MSNFSHIPVMLSEAVFALKVVRGQKYIDGTLGGGGHTKLILENGGIVLGIDRDDDAISHVSTQLKQNIDEGALTVVKGNFGEIEKIAKEYGFEKVDGILLDIGVSGYQMDSAQRGFSIRHDETLDMRMDPAQELTAYDVVNSYPKEKLIEIFYRYGEEHNAIKIADEIVATRKKKEIKTTRELASIIERIPHKSEPIHPATRVFQAIRIEVNGELDQLQKGLNGGVGILTSGGRLVVISFHSLEDRIVKKTFELFQKNGRGTVVTKKPIIAGFNEVSKNKRSRSAKMRVFEKI